MHRKREMCSDHINKQFWWRSMSKCDEKSGSGSCVFSCCIINGLMKIPVISKYSAIQSSHCFLYTSHMVCFAHCFPLSVVHLHNDLCSQKKESKKNYINCKVSVCVYTQPKSCVCGGVTLKTICCIELRALDSLFVLNFNEKLAQAWERFGKEGFVHLLFCQRSFFSFPFVCL